MAGEQKHRKTCERWNIPWEPHELTFSCLRRRPFLAADRTRAYFIESLAAARWRHNFRLWAYVIMPEHVHLLIWPGREHYNISEILKSIKQSVGRKAIAYLRRYNPRGLAQLATGQAKEPYRFWLDGGGYDRNVRTKEEALKFMKYIHNNPVKRGLVQRPEDWPWSSYRDWEGLAKGPIPLDMESLWSW
jgi:putative transposase